MTPQARRKLRYARGNFIWNASSMPDKAQREAEKSPKSLSILSQFGLTCREGIVTENNAIDKTDDYK